MVNNIKIKIKPKTHLSNPKTKPSYWYCDLCKKKYAKGGKYQHLKTDFHKLNEAKKGPQGTLILLPQPRRSKNPGDYVENRLIKLITEKRLRDSFLGGTLIDDPISPSVNLLEPLIPTEYRHAPPVPKPRTKPPVPKPRTKPPVPLPRLKIIRPIKPVPTEL